MDTSLGRELPRAKPVTLTFYDMLGDVPFTTTFYVHEEETDERIEALVKAIRDVSLCVLGEYKIGHRAFTMPDYRIRLKEIPKSTLGGHKWVVKYRIKPGSLRSMSIPGRDDSLAINSTRSIMGKAGKAPNPDHPKWQALVALFKQICISKEGVEVMEDLVELDYRNEAWPPKGAKKR
jgi:hypothetical protein